jgi:ceroid-lipofuscinosis MFS transporter 7
MLYISQFLLGVGTGSLGVTRSFVSEQCEGNTRTYQLARLSALQYAGFAMTPLIGSALFDAGYTLPSPPLAFVSHYWAYSLPAYIMTGLAIISVCLTIYPFKDFEQKINKPTVINADVVVTIDGSDNIDDELVDLEHDHRTSLEYKKRKYIKKIGDINEIVEIIESDSKRKKYLELNFFYCYWLLACLNFTTRGILSIYETMSAHALLTTYNLSEFEVGYIVSIGGTIGTLNLLFYKQIWLRHFNEFQLMVCGFFTQAFLLLLLSNVGPDTEKSLGRFLVSQILTYAFAYPIR